MYFDNEYFILCAIILNVGKTVGKHQSQLANAGKLLPCTNANLPPGSMTIFRLRWTLIRTRKTIPCSLWEWQHCSTELIFFVFNQKYYIRCQILFPKVYTNSGKFTETKWTETCNVSGNVIQNRDTCTFNTIFLIFIKLVI